MGIESFLNLAKLLGCKIIFYKTELFSADDLEYPDNKGEVDENDDELLGGMEADKRKFIEEKLQSFPINGQKNLERQNGSKSFFTIMVFRILLNLLESWHPVYRADSIKKSAQLFDAEEDLKLESLKEGLKEEIEMNIERWSNTVAEDKEFQKTKAFRARMYKSQKYFQNLKDQGIIQPSMRLLKPR